MITYTNLNACKILTQRLKYFLKKTIKVLTKKYYSVEYVCLQRQHVL